MGFGRYGSQSLSPTKYVLAVELYADYNTLALILPFFFIFYKYLNYNKGLLK